MPERMLTQPVDDAARRQAKEIIRSARYAALGALEPGTGWPHVSRASIATDLDGSPIILISRLSAHFGALESDNRASLLVGEPGRGDPFAHPRLTLFGRAGMLAGADRERARRRFLSRHPKAVLYADFGDFAFWRIVPERVSLNGGFGKAFELVLDDLAIQVPDELERLEAEAVAHMNDDHADAVQLYAERLAGKKRGRWMVTGIDPEGIDLASADETARIWFDTPLATGGELRRSLAELARRARNIEH